MEVYTTENEQIDAIKRFFVNNGKALVIGLAVGVGAIIGWNYWQLHQADRLQESAQAFEQISSQLQTGSKQVLAAGEQFANETNNIYGVLTNIELAKIAVEKSDIAGAEKALLKALAVAKLDDLKDLINVRLARVQLALNKTDQALITLTQVQDKGWSTIVEDIRGDVLLKKGDVAGARAAYSEGIESSGAEMMKTILKIKINSLPN
ncbi:YfgM family protein [Candidatus Arsenophonus triatominarum]|uniref:YfgM family protein n=1 Tax=Candidatus Arsenophonus triatominarum TaxID=57911 RepID=UPI0007C477C3|nr:YfgM family protein [Candidatus Arsenophonus triatominarum]